MDSRKVRQRNYRRSNFSSDLREQPAFSSCVRTLYLAFVLAGLNAYIASAQLNSDSWWPKFQRDSQNSGYVPLVGWAADAHVVWTIQLSPPIVTENHATPILSSYNNRLYIGGPDSTLSAVDLSDGSLVWTVVLGDGTGRIYQTAVLGSDDSIYVGAWDTAAPYDGFCKIRDEGDQASIVWTFPMQRQLASPTITSDGLIIVGGQDEFDEWGYFALEDLGNSYALAWIAGQLADPNDPNSTGAIASSPALSPDQAWIFGGSHANTTFWQIDAQTGFEQARLSLDCYCYAPSPVVSDDGYAFIGEGMSIPNPDEQTEGKLYAFEPDESGVLAEYDTQPLFAGHLNSGTAALRRRLDGYLRLYVPANNGYDTQGSARLIAVDFDPNITDPNDSSLEMVWELSIGSSALVFLQAAVTRDELVYVLGPSNHQLYALCDGGGQVTTQWTLSLDAISRAAEWYPGARGPQGVMIGPDGTLYWNAVDGYLYAIQGWLRGDFDADQELSEVDLDWLVTALVDPEGYQQRFPELDAVKLGDWNGNGQLDFFDINLMQALLNDA